MRSKNFFGDVVKINTLWTICLKPQIFLFEPANENGNKREDGIGDCEMNWFDRYTGKGSDFCVEQDEKKAGKAIRTVVFQKCNNGKEVYTGAFDVKWDIFHFG